MFELGEPNLARVSAWIAAAFGLSVGMESDERKEPAPPNSRSPAFCDAVELSWLHCLIHRLRKYGCFPFRHLKILCSSVQIIPKLYATNDRGASGHQSETRRSDEHRS
jgi:hypothetical protein